MKKIIAAIALAMVVGILLSGCALTTDKASLNLNNSTIVGQVSSVNGKQVTLTLGSAGGMFGGFPGGTQVTPPGSSNGNSGGGNSSSGNSNNNGSGSSNNNGSGSSNGNSNNSGGSGNSNSGGNNSGNSGSSGSSGNSSDNSSSSNNSSSNSSNSGNSGNYGSNGSGSNSSSNSNNNSSTYPGRSTVTLTINSNSILTKNGQSVKVSDIQVGDTLSISFGKTGAIQSITITSGSGQNNIWGNPNYPNSQQYGQSDQT